jgi:hypothetical protein
MGCKSIPTFKQIFPGYSKSVITDIHLSLAFYISKCAIKVFPQTKKIIQGYFKRHISLGFYKSRWAVKAFPQTDRLFRAILQTCTLVWPFKKTILTNCIRNSKRILFFFKLSVKFNIESKSPNLQNLNLHKKNNYFHGEIIRLVNSQTIINQIVKL